VLLLGCLAGLLLGAAAGKVAELASQAGDPMPIDQPLPPNSLSAGDISTEKVHQFV